MDKIQNINTDIYQVSQEIKISSADSNNMADVILEITIKPKNNG